MVKGARYSFPLKSKGCFSLGCNGTSTCISLASPLDCLPLQKPHYLGVLSIVDHDIVVMSISIATSNCSNFFFQQKLCKIRSYLEPLV